MCVCVVFICDLVFQQHVDAWRHIKQCSVRSRL